MALYCFVCPKCQARVETPVILPEPTCTEHGTMRRDYRAEGVSPAVANLTRERNGWDMERYKRTFLPTAEDYAGPNDPDGSKGLRKWNDEHGPRDDNKNPARPAVPKRVF